MTVVSTVTQGDHIVEETVLTPQMTEGRSTEESVALPPTPYARDPLYEDVIKAQPEDLREEWIEIERLCELLREFFSITSVVDTGIIDRMTNSQVKRNVLWNWMSTPNWKYRGQIYGRMVNSVSNYFAGRLKTSLCRECKEIKFGYDSSSGSSYCLRCNTPKVICLQCGKPVLRAKIGMCRSCHTASKEEF